ncbi:uncharacterized protein LOC126895264 [Daktulosphaira vitifoliae]|uniref:uncharacterized protein LOC126895264 n=1 Tax=Daktulosphaira vitifoliae TaxID=58002 RepID=UPI0021A9EC9E|nr:uncharacterized protein LOC126895264 [Daktulosphaira vitifoliae]
MLQLKNYSLVALCCIILNAVFSCYCISYFKPPSNRKAQKPRFLPVGCNWQYKKCKELGFQMMNICIPKKPEKYRNIPKTLVYVPGDGNCFFSALSYWISGTVKNGQVLREMIVNYMKDSNSFKLMTKEEERETRISKMYNTYEYAESPEIATAAEFLDISIYIYTLYPLMGWHFISKNGIVNKDENERCLYLLNDREHYDVVIDVFPNRKARQPEDILRKMNEYSDYNIPIDFSNQSISKSKTNSSTKETKQNKTPQPVPQTTKDNQKLQNYTNEDFENYIKQVKNRIRTEEIEQQRLDKLNGNSYEEISKNFIEKFHRKQSVDEDQVQPTSQFNEIPIEQDSKSKKKDISLNKRRDSKSKKKDISLSKIRNNKPKKKDITLSNDNEHVNNEYIDERMVQNNGQLYVPDIPLHQNYRTPEHVNNEYIDERMVQNNGQLYVPDIPLHQNYRTPDSKQKKEDISLTQELVQFTDDFFNVGIEQNYPSEIRNQTTKRVGTSQKEDTSFSLDFFYRIHHWTNYQ